MSVRLDRYDHMAGRIPMSAFPDNDPPAAALLIACADGCMPPGSLEAQLQTEGLLVTRNPGNLVPPSGGDGMAQSVEQALARGARELIVCGHIGCPTVARLLDPQTALEDLVLAVWLEHAEAVRLALQSLPLQEQLARAVEVNVTQQLAHLRVYPAVAAALFQGRVQLHGWVYDPVRDEILAPDTNTGRFTRRAALDPTQNRLFRKERLRTSSPLPWSDLSSLHLA